MDDRYTADLDVSGFEEGSRRMARASDQAERRVTRSMSLASAATMKLGQRVLAGGALWAGFSMASAAVEAYAASSASAAAEVEKIGRAWAGVKVSVGRDLLSAGAEDVTRAVGLLGRAREWVTDVYADSFASLATASNAFGGSAALRGMQRASEANERVTAARAAADLAVMEAAERAAERVAGMNGVGGVGGVGVERAEAAMERAIDKARRDRLLSDAEREVVIDKEMRLYSVAAGAEREIAGVRAGAAARELAHEEAMAGVRVARLRADADEALGLSGKAEAMRREADLAERLLEIDRLRVSEGTRARLAGAERAAAAERESAARREVREAVRGEMEARLLGARAEEPATKKAAELARLRLENERRIADLERAGATAEELRAVRGAGAAQEESLLGVLARDRRERRRGVSIAGGLSGVAGLSLQVAGGDARAKAERDAAAARARIERTAAGIYEELRALVGALNGGVVGRFGV
jgi:hypothetical protein